MKRKNLTIEKFEISSFNVYNVYFVFSFIHIFKLKIDNELRRTH